MDVIKSCRPWEIPLPGGGGGTSTISSPNVPLSYNLKPLKDLVIFEERIRQNLTNLHSMRRRLRLRIFSLLIATLFLIVLHVRFVNIHAIYSNLTFLTFLGLVLLYLSLITSAILLLASLRLWRHSLTKRYEEQCQKTLRQFNLQLTYGKEKELTFVKRLPKRLAELLEAYRFEYRARRALQLNPSSKKTK